MADVDSLAELIRRSIEAKLIDVHTCLPGTIVSYDSATVTAKIRLGVMHALPKDDGSLALEQYPILPDVPIHFQQGGGYSVTFPLIPGDTVLVIFNETDVSQWLLTGQTSPPNLQRRFNLGSCWAIPGAKPTSTPLPAAADPSLCINGGEVKVGLLAADYVAMNAKVVAELTSIASFLINHKHSGVTAGAGSTGVSDSAYAAPADVAATNLKAES